MTDSASSAGTSKQSTPMTTTSSASQSRAFERVATGSFGPAIEEENFGNTSGLSGRSIADSPAWSR